MKDTTKRYLISSGVSFIAGFALAVAPLLDDNLTLEAVKEGAIIGVLFVGIRAGFKALLEMIATILSAK
jgi:hypothetical protein